MEFLPICYMVNNQGQLIDLTYMCGNPPAIVEAVPAEPDYITRARETIANPNSDERSINTARIILNTHASWLISQERSRLFWQRIKDGQ